MARRPHARRRSGARAGRQRGQHRAGPGLNRDRPRCHPGQDKQLLSLGLTGHQAPLGQHRDQADRVDDGQDRAIAPVELVAEHIRMQASRPGQLLLGSPGRAPATPQLGAESAQVMHRLLRPGDATLPRRQPV
jgi:hypothetical protein